MYLVKNVQRMLYFKVIILCSDKNEKDLGLHCVEGGGLLLCWEGNAALIWSGLIKQKQSGDSIAQMCCFKSFLCLG